MNNHPRDEHVRKPVSSLVYYRDAERALKNLDEMLGKSHPDARDSVLKMTHLLLNKGRRIVLYLGAGCSMAVKVTTPKGHAEFRGKSWMGLLRGLLNTMSRAKRDEFILYLKARRETVPKITDPDDISHYLPYVDKLQVAWYLSLLLGETKRDEEISKLVEPPGDATASSPLHRELLKLPFDDIVTTNYDRHIARFLLEPDEERQEKIAFAEITNSTDLISNSEVRHRLFYLHGKVGQSTPLVFDRFDYAKLMSERDGLLDYVTYLLMDSHVIYVGFGLDDPTFNLMETRLQTLHGVYRPQSFAFVPLATEMERTRWRERKLDIIDYGEVDNLPIILKGVNTTLKFVGWAEKKRPKDVDPKADRTEHYLAAALDHYVHGGFKESLLECRAALASTLFWERQPSKSGHAPILSFDEAARLCEIRIRMASIHYKLHWAPNEIEDHGKALDENQEAARDIIEKQKAARDIIEKRRPGEDAQSGALDALENSLNILKARVLYHKDQLEEALKIYEGVVSNRQPQIPSKKAHENLSSAEDGEPRRISDEARKKMRSRVLWELKFDEGYFYAKCQISRIAYQLAEESSLDGLTDRDEQVRSLDHLEKQIEQFRNFIAESPSDCKTLPEWGYYRNSMGILHRIAVWTAGRHAVGVCRDVIPTKEERNPETCKKLSDGIKRLEKDPMDTDSSLLREDDLIDAVDLVGNLRDGDDLLSTYLRSQFAPETRLLLNQNAPPNRPSGGLLSALVEDLNRVIGEQGLYESNRFAFVPAAALEKMLDEFSRDRKLNLNRMLLEYAYSDLRSKYQKMMSPRWSALRYRYLCRGYALRWVVGQDRVSREARGDSDLADAYKNIQKALHVAGGPGLERERMVNLLEAARLNVLAMFGERIGNGKERKSNSVSPLSFGAGLYYLDAAFREKDKTGWLTMLGYRIASYFAIVSGQGRRAEFERVSENKTLFEFLRLDVDQMRDTVANEHRKFAASQGKVNVLDRRIESYERGVAAIRSEIGA